MQKILEKLSEMFVVKKVDKESYILLSSFYYPNSLNVFTIKLVKKNDKIYLTDNGATVAFLDDNELRINTKLLSELSETYKVNYQNYELFIETDLDTLTFDLANLIQAIVLFSQGEKY